MMVDVYKYDQTYVVHDVDEDFESGEGYSTLEDAIDAAKDTAVMSGANMEISHVLVRLLKHVIVETKVEDA